MIGQDGQRSTNDHSSSLLLTTPNSLKSITSLFKNSSRAALTQLQYYRQQRNATDTLGRGPGERPKAFPVARCHLGEVSMSTLNKIRKCQTLKGKTCRFCSWAERTENKLVRFSTAPFFLLTPPGLTTTFQDLCARPSWICMKPSCSLFHQRPARSGLNPAHYGRSNIYNMLF